MFYKRKVVHGCQVYLDGLGMFSNVKELIIHTQWNSFVENKGKKVFTETVRQFYANPRTNSRINEKVYEVSSMVNKRHITVTLKDGALYLMLPLHGEDIFNEEGHMDMNMTFSPNKQYEILLGNNNEEMSTGSRSANLLTVSDRIFFKIVNKVIFPYGNQNNELE